MMTSVREAIDRLPPAAETGTDWRPRRVETLGLNGSLCNVVRYQMHLRDAGELADWLAGEPRPDRGGGISGLRDEMIAQLRGSSTGSGRRHGRRRPNRSPPPIRSTSAGCMGTRRLRDTTVSSRPSTGARSRRSCSARSAVRTSRAPRWRPRSAGRTCRSGCSSSGRSCSRGPVARSHGRRPRPLPRRSRTPTRSSPTSAGSSGPTIPTRR